MHKNAVEIIARELKVDLQILRGCMKFKRGLGKYWGAAEGLKKDFKILRGCRRIKGGLENYNLDYRRTKGGLMFGMIRPSENQIRMCRLK